MTLRTASPLDLPIGVKAMTSPAFPEPGVFGVRRAILLLPAGIADRLTPPQLHAVVTHELCHVRRRDNLAAALHMGVEAVFWFHPLVWWLGARLMEERERACDEEVLLLGNEPEVYAQGILEICELYLESPLRCVAGVTGANLRKRIETIMANRVGLRLSYVKKLALLTAGVAAVASPLIVGVMNPPAIQAQSQQPAATARAFEVASVKPNHSVTGNSSIKTAPGGRFTAENVSPRALIQLAFGIRDFQLAGGPGWIGTEKYDVVAKTGGPKEMSSDEELKPPLQALLVDRFMLRFHRQTKQLPVYALVVAGGRPKLTANTATSATPSTSISSGGDKLKMEATKSSMARLCNILGRQLDRTVIDKTGLKGEFDFNLEWAPDQVVDSSGPSIFAALQEQLGLKLQARKGPVEIIVIDRIDRPAAN
jgi:uncharacterized protein (TIGR03435 family)